MRQGNRVSARGNVAEPGVESISTGCVYRTQDVGWVDVSKSR